MSGRPWSSTSSNGPLISGNGSSRSRELGRQAIAKQSGVPTEPANACARQSWTTSALRKQHTLVRHIMEQLQVRQLDLAGIVSEQRHRRADPGIPSTVSSTIPSRPAGRQDPRTSDRFLPLAIQTQPFRLVKQPACPDCFGLLFHQGTIVVVWEDRQYLSGNTGTPPGTWKPCSIPPGTGSAPACLLR